MKSMQETLTESFAFVQDCDRIYNAVKEKLLQYKLEFPDPSNILAKQMNLHNRSESMINEIERQMLSLNKDFLF